MVRLAARLDPYCHTGAEAFYVSVRTVWSAIHPTADIQTQASEVRGPTRNQDPIPSRELRLSGLSGHRSQCAETAESSLDVTYDWAQPRNRNGQDSSSSGALIGGFEPLGDAA